MTVERQEKKPALTQLLLGARHWLSPCVNIISICPRDSVVKLIVPSFFKLDETGAQIVSFAQGN